MRRPYNGCRRAPLPIAIEEKCLRGLRGFSLDYSEISAYKFKLSILYYLKSGDLAQRAGSPMALYTLNLNHRRRVFQHV